MRRTSYLSFGYLSVLLDDTDAQLLVVGVRQCVLDLVLVGADQSLKGVTHDDEGDGSVDRFAELELEIWF